MQTKSEMINRIAELAEENAKLKKYIERMDKPEIQVIDAEILTLKEENAKLKAENERLKKEVKYLEEEISDFISDISTCGFKYDDRCPDDLDELQCCIEDLCNKFSNYKQTLQEIKEKCNEARRTGRKAYLPIDILDVITKAEEE